MSFKTKQKMKAGRNAAVEMGSPRRVVIYVVIVIRRKSSHNPIHFLSTLSLQTKLDFPIFLLRGSEIVVRRCCFP